MPTTVPTSVPGRSPDPLTRAQAHADAGRKNAFGCHQPIVVHRPWRHPRTGRRRQRPRRRPAPIAMPCSPASWSPLEHVGRRSRSFPPDQAEVGVVRLTTAGEGRLEGLVLVQSDGRRGDGNKASIRQAK